MKKGEFEPLEGESKKRLIVFSQGRFQIGRHLEFLEKTARKDELSESFRVVAGHHEHLDMAGGQNDSCAAASEHVEFHEQVIELVVLLEPLICYPFADRPLSRPFEPTAMIFSHGEVEFPVRSVQGVRGRCSAKGIDPAGAWTVLVHGATCGGHKRA